MRVGTGYDLHELVPGRALVLGGVEIPFELGLRGHSDADVLTHAIIDALLGAAALGDIGQWFPDTNPVYKGASSIGLLKVICEKLRDKGYEIENVDSSVVIEKLRLTGYMEEIRKGLARAMSISIDRVSVKAKTNEGLGAEGRGEAVSVHAIVMLAGK